MGGLFAVFSFVLPKDVGGKILAFSKRRSFQHDWWRRVGRNVGTNTINERCAFLVDRFCRINSKIVVGFDVESILKQLHFNDDRIGENPVSRSPD